MFKWVFDELASIEIGENSEKLVKKYEKLKIVDFSSNPPKIETKKDLVNKTKEIFVCNLRNFAWT